MSFKGQGVYIEHPPYVGIIINAAQQRKQLRKSRVTKAHMDVILASNGSPNTVLKKRSSICKNLDLFASNNTFRMLIS
jgi:hypothetical protein